MMNLKINKPSPLLQKGEYQATIARYTESDEYGIITLKINDKSYKVWMKDNLISINGETTTGAQLIMDAMCQQIANTNSNILDMVETTEELFTVLVQTQTPLTVWATVYEDRLNNFNFYKPKDWDAEQALGI